MKTYDHLARSFFNEPWMITERKMAQLQAFALAKLAGEPTAWEGVRQEPFAATTYEAEGAPSGNKVAVLPLYGVMMQRVGMMAEMSGATSTEKFKRAFLEQVNNPQIKTIILDVDTPGGSVYGVDELATIIRDASAKKQVVAVANSLIASAGYYAVSGVSEIVASPSSEIGSIGVLAVHYDYSTQDEIEGITPTLIKAGKYKAEGHPDFPLGDDARQHIQEDVDRYYTMFVNAVAKGRGVSASTVRSGFGEGRVVGAQEAVRLGMADRVATLDETIARFLGGGRPAKRGASAETIILPIGASEDAGEEEQPVGAPSVNEDTAAPAPAVADDAFARQLAAAGVLTGPAHQS